MALRVDAHRRKLVAFMFHSIVARRRAASNPAFASDASEFFRLGTQTARHVCDTPRERQTVSASENPNFRVLGPVFV
jgi:hypothetical protein